jgi:hypothetical protein
VKLTYFRVCFKQIETDFKTFHHISVASFLGVFLDINFIVSKQINENNRLYHAYFLHLLPAELGNLICYVFIAVKIHTVVFQV